MSAKSERGQSPSPSDVPSPSPSPLVIDSNPAWLPGSPWGLVDNHEDSKTNIWTEPRDKKHWKECREMLKKHDETALSDWMDENNTQLLVSSLLAAVAGGSVVESQKSLSEDPTITSAVILFQIAHQLNQSIGLPSTDLVAFGGPSRVERAFNSLFYASLGLSLANVTLGLLCLQWIRGIKREPPGVSFEEYISLSYVRHRGFEFWGAKGVISALPLLLLASLLAFFAGLLAFASNSDWIASIPLYVILTSVFAVVIFTTFAPGLVIVLNSAFRKGSQFPSVPPFRSLQSWIAIQGFIQIFQAINRVFRLNPFGAFPSLRKCLDWGQVDLLWTGWAIKKAEDVLLLPILLSAGTTKEKMNTISNIIEELYKEDIEPMFRKMEVLKKLSLLGERLPARTQGHITGLLVAELVGLINTGASIDTLSSAFYFEENKSLDCVPLETTLQLVNSLSFLCRTATPSTGGFWNLFWRALAEAMQCVPYIYDPATPPMLFNDALNSMQIALEDPSTDTDVVFQHGFKSFITTLAYEVEHERAWARSYEGSVTLSAILSHPIWAAARGLVTELSPGEHTAAAQKCMRRLDRIRENVPPASNRPVLMEGGESSVDLQELASEGEHGQPATPSSPSHIVIDIEPKDDVEHAVSDEASLQADTGPDEDKDASAVGPRTSPAEELLTIVTSTLFALPTPPVDSATSPPQLEV